MEVCIRGRATAVKLLCEKGADVYAKDAQGMTALELACQNMKIECVRTLSKYDTSSDKALREASKNGQAAWVKVLVAAGVGVNSTNEKDRTALHEACQCGKIECVRELMASRHLDINAQDRNGCSALMLACQSGNYVCVKELIDREADVNAKDHNGMTALALACKNGWVKNVHALMGSRTVYLNVKNEGGMAPLSIACEHEHVDCVKELINHGVDINETLLEACQNKKKHKWVKMLAEAEAYFGDFLRVACQEEKTDWLETCEKAGINFNDILSEACQKKKQDWINVLVAAHVNFQEFLQNACHQKKPEWVKMLVRARANLHDFLKDACQQKKPEWIKILMSAGLNAQNELLVALREANTQCASVLVEAGARISKNKGKDLLHEACQNHEKRKLVKVLLEAGADGERELRLACRENRWVSVQILAEAGNVNINAQDKEGKTALIEACINDCPKCVQALLRAGADLEIRDKKEKTAYWHASNKSNSCAEILVEAGADVLARDNHGKTGSGGNASSSAGEQLSQEIISKVLTIVSPNAQAQPNTWTQRNNRRR